MERNYKFKIGQTVSMWDEDDECNVRGVVTDTSRDTVFIKWEDLHDPTEHLQEEFHKMRVI